MKLKEVDPSMLVKVGMTDGTGYIFTGKMGDCDFQTLDTECEAMAWEKMDKIAAIVRKWTAKFTANKIEYLLNAHDYIVNYVPLAEREVVEIRPSIAEKNVYIVMVEGNMDGKLWMVDETPRKLKINKHQSMIPLLGEMYKPLVEQLYVEYQKIILKKGKKREKAIDAAKQLENEITDDPAVSFVIRKARLEAAKSACYRNGRFMMKCDDAQEILKKCLQS